MRPKFQYAIYPPHIFSLRSNKRGPRGRPLASVADSILAGQDGTRALLGRIGNLTAGQRAPASRLTNAFVLPSADPPRRGFRKPAGLRCLTPASGQGTTPPTPHIPALSHPVQSQFIPFVQGPGECAGAPGLFSRFVGAKITPLKFSRTVWASPKRLEI